MNTGNSQIHNVNALVVSKQGYSKTTKKPIYSSSKEQQSQILNSKLIITTVFKSARKFKGARDSKKLYLVLMLCSLNRF